MTSIIKKLLVVAVSTVLLTVISFLMPPWVDELFQRILTAYIDYLKANPETITENLKWSLCTVFCWVMIIISKERILTGLEGMNKLLEGSETAVYIAILMLPPTLFHLLFYTGASHGLALWALGFEGMLIGFAIIGPKIFDYFMAALSAIRGGGGGKITEVTKKDEHTESVKVEDPPK